MNTTKSNTSFKTIIIILIILFTVLAYFAYNNYRKNQDSERALQKEKRELQTQIDTKILELDKAIAENTTMNEELKEAKYQMIAFRDSMQNIRRLNYKTLKTYKKKLAFLETQNKKLLRLSDSLKRTNLDLNIRMDSAEAKIQQQVVIIEKQTKAGDSLSKLTDVLSEKVARGAVLQIRGVETIAMKERRSGKMVETYRARKTDALKTSFRIQQNFLAEAGPQKIYIVVQNTTNKKVIASKGSFTDNQGKSINYTDVTEVAYKNQETGVVFLTAIPENSIEKGNYSIKVYLKDKLAGTTHITLK